MAWCRQATSHFLSQCWPRSIPQYGVIEPQWVNYPVGHAQCTWWKKNSLWRNGTKMLNLKPFYVWIVLCKHKNIFALSSFLHRDGAGSRNPSSWQKNKDLLILQTIRLLMTWRHDSWIHHIVLTSLAAAVWHCRSQSLWCIFHVACDSPH